MSKFVQLQKALQEAIEIVEGRPCRSPFVAVEDWKALLVQLDGELDYELWLAKQRTDASTWSAAVQPTPETLCVYCGSEIQGNEHALKLRAHLPCIGLNVDLWPRRDPCPEQPTPETLRAFAPGLAQITVEVGLHRKAVWVIPCKGDDVMYLIADALAEGRIRPSEER